ncbi:hypothetical protein EDB85DRAFT_2256034 [Lactarius pseudohatsudake]|nr:hypothetical protein EDB85DRAFT_2256034 [Lactarius pseudohatsudake]
MYRCDELNLNGTKRLSTQVRATYGTAQKMRASMTYAFGRIHGLGSVHWEHGADGRTAGNPSVSKMVSRYMLSLHRRKVKAGETATSARAISADTLKKLYHFNFRPEFRGKRDYALGRKKADDQWGGQRARRLLGLAYTIAFTCLLCVDEALKIQSQDITMLSKNKFQLTLLLRKTSQFGNIEPFVLHRMPKSMAHLCPVRAYAAWLKVSRISHGIQQISTQWEYFSARSPAAAAIPVALSPFLPRRRRHVTVVVALAAVVPAAASPLLSPSTSPPPSPSTSPPPPPSALPSSSSPS